MPDFPLQISQFLQKHHVLTLGVYSAETIWAANCFYVFDPTIPAFYILSQLGTQHAQMMLQAPQVAGTVYTETTTIALIQGVQYRAKATLLAGHDAQTAYAQYYACFPFARSIPAPVWQLGLTHVKFTDNTETFGKKLSWAQSALDDE